MKASPVTAGIDDAGTRAAARAPTTPWANRVRWVGGLMQCAFAASWLVRGSLAIGGGAVPALLAASALLVVGSLGYAIRAAAGSAPRPSAGRHDKRIELQITIATLIEFAAAIILPALATAAGHSDWTLPSIAITVGPLLLWLDYAVSLPRYRPVGRALTIGPLVLVATLSGTTLVAAAGLGGGILLLGTALMGFGELAATKATARRSSADALITAAGSHR